MAALSYSWEINAGELYVAVKNDTNGKVTLTKSKPKVKAVISILKQELGDDFMTNLEAVEMSPWMKLLVKEKVAKYKNSNREDKAKLYELFYELAPPRTPAREESESEKEEEEEEESQKDEDETMEGDAYADLRRDAEDFLRKNRLSNSAYNLGIFLQKVLPAVKAFFAEHMSEEEMAIYQNGNAMIRVLALADEPSGQRYNREGGVRMLMPVEAPVNIIGANLQVKQIKVNLDRLRDAYYAARPKLTDFKKNEGSTATEESMCAQCMTYVMKSVLAPDQIFGPGVSVVRRLGFPPGLTVLFEGLNIPFKYLKHNRSAGGIGSDLAGLKRSRGNRTNQRGKTIFEVIQAKIKERCRTENQKKLVGTMSQYDDEGVFENKLFILGTSFLVEPARTTRAFLPPIASLMRASTDDYPFHTKNFLENAEQAKLISKAYGCKVAVDENLTMRVARTCAVVGILGSSFVSAAVIAHSLDEVEVARANIKAVTFKPKMKQVYKAIKNLKIGDMSFEMRPESVRNEGDAGWQVAAMNSFGNETVFNYGQVSEMMGGESGKSGTSVRGLVKIMLAAAKEKTGRKIITRWMTETGPKRYVLTSAGLFSADFSDIKDDRNDRLNGMTIDEEDDEQ